MMRSLGLSCLSISDFLFLQFFMFLSVECPEVLVHGVIPSKGATAAWEEQSAPPLPSASCPALLTLLWTFVWLFSSMCPYMSDQAISGRLLVVSPGTSDPCTSVILLTLRYMHCSNSGESYNPGLQLTFVYVRGQSLLVLRYRITPIPSANIVLSLLIFYFLRDPCFGLLP